MYFFTTEILFSNISNFSSLSTNFSNCLGAFKSFPVASFTVSKNLYGCAVPRTKTFDIIGNSNSEVKNYILGKIQ